MKDIKEKIFALYWGQKIAIVEWPATNSELDKTTVADTCFPYIKHLLLTSLSNISDEDAIEVARILYPSVGDWQVPYRQGDDVWMTANDDSEIEFVITDGLFEAHGFILADEFKRVLAAIDYLRNGTKTPYALPAFNLSAQQQIDQGIIKIRE